MLAGTLNTSDSMDQDTPAAVPFSSRDLTAAASAEPPPASQAGSFDTKERVRLMRDGVVNYSGFVTNGLAGIILVPVMLRYLGTRVLWPLARRPGRLGHARQF